MTLTPRQSAVRGISAGSLKPEIDPATRKPLSSLFGANVFGDQAMRERLPKPIYQQLRRTIDAGDPIDPSIADAVATAMKDWAIEKGATHYTHWFQPMTGLTAEKHDSFLEPTRDGRALLEFSGDELIQGEPDASSFPSGGLRATFEARGYTAWDPTSPAFLRETTFGSTLTIPTAFAAWTGEALDTKTPMLRSCAALDAQARRLLALLGDRDVARVTPTVGPEQEYFLVDREFFYLRPDLISCGRTLLGARPPKGQELEDHYFGATPQRVLAFQMDLERELWRLGIPVTTRHNEVAPSQFELAAVYETGTLAVDHNMLTMELLGVVAERHGLKCLLHEKPFAGVNGSGKHNNWSLADDRGNNLLDPGQTPHENLVFVVFLTAILRAVDLHADLLRASIAHAGNDHRLGANEAPPAILSVFLGAELEGVVESIVKGTPPAASERGEKLKLGVNTLPPLPRDTSDRNRTSPFAFTGNKFEFRAVGSTQSLAYPNLFLNTAVAESLDHLSSQIESRGASPESIQAIVRETLSEHQRILFSGDNYTAEWAAEAERRGLLNLRDTPSALARITLPKNVELFSRYEVFTQRETESCATVLFEHYVHRVNVEALSLLDMASTQVVPAAREAQRRAATSLTAAQATGLGLDLGAQERAVRDLGESLSALLDGIDALRRVRTECEESGDGPGAMAAAYRERVLPAMDTIRRHADRLETLVDDDVWPLPKYREILYVR